MKRSTLALFAAFLILVGIAWYLTTTKEKPQALEPTATQQAIEYLFAYDSSTLLSLRIQDVAGSALTLARDAAASWLVTEPAEKTTDAGLAAQLISQLSALQVLTTITQTASASDYGLLAPAYVITVKTIDGWEHRALVGISTPTGSGYYVQLDGGKIMIVSKYGLDALLNALSSPPIVTTPTATAPITTTVTMTATLPVSLTLTLTPTFLTTGTPTVHP